MKTKRSFSTSDTGNNILTTEISSYASLATSSSFVTDTKFAIEDSSHSTGDYIPESKIIRVIQFDRYEIEIEVTDTGVFKNVLSIKVNKKFIDSLKVSANPDVHDVDKYYTEE